MVPFPDCAFLGQGASQAGGHSLTRTECLPHLVYLGPCETGLHRCVQNLESTGPWSHVRLTILHQKFDGEWQHLRGTEEASEGRNTVRECGIWFLKAVRLLLRAHPSPEIDDSLCSVLPVIFSLASPPRLEINVPSNYYMNLNSDIQFSPCSL